MMIMRIISTRERVDGDFLSDLEPVGLVDDDWLKGLSKNEL